MFTGAASLSNTIASSSSKPDCRTRIKRFAAENYEVGTAVDQAFVFKLPHHKAKLVKPLCNL